MKHSRVDINEEQKLLKRVQVDGHIVSGIFVNGFVLFYFSC